MNKNKLNPPSILLGLSLTCSLLSSGAYAKDTVVDDVRHKAEIQVKTLAEPLVAKYCGEQCKILNVDGEVEVAVPEELSPGFDDGLTSNLELKTSSVKVKLLMDQMMGAESRAKLVSLIQQHMEGLSYPVSIETKLASFPQPPMATKKFAELKERVGTQYKTAINDLFKQICPEGCVLGTTEIRAEPVSAEEAASGNPSEYFQDGEYAIRVSKAQAQIVFDTTISREEQANILDMAKMRTSFLKNGEVVSKSMRFPEALTTQMIADRRSRGIGADGEYSTDAKNTNRSIASTDEKKMTESKLNSSTSSLNSKEQNTNLNSTTASNNASTNSSSNESALKQERFEKYEKIERVEDGDAIQKELKMFKTYGLVFACAMISLLIFIAVAGLRGSTSGHKTGSGGLIQKLVQDPINGAGNSSIDGGKGSGPSSSPEGRNTLLVTRYEIERLKEELMAIFAEQPKVAKQVFTRVLTEEGIEVTASYLDMFGETIVMDMLRDPSLQADLQELMEFFSKNNFDVEDDEKLELLKRLHNRTVAAKMVVMGSRTSFHFDFLSDMDGYQILELVKNESVTVKAVVLTQCENQKRVVVFQQLDEGTRMKLLSELSRIDHLPKDYIANVASSLKRKRAENPKLNTEALPGSDVLVTLLEKADHDTQRSIVINLETTNPDSARIIKSRLVSIDTLRYLMDGEVMDVITSLKHEEMLTFLAGTTDAILDTVFAVAPESLAADLQEELGTFAQPMREAYQAVERKVINRIKILAQEGKLNLLEVNERVFGISTDNAGQNTDADGQQAA